ncbi:MAG: translation initiation factor 2 [Clostridiales bacterium]|nr:translation initiation factor 2 [Clostridiales bacterium]
MVKGISRRVIVVRSPDPRFFEQAIFLMKEDALHAQGVTAEQVVNEARQAAAGYLRRTSDPKGWRQPSARLPWWVWFALGACAVGLVWLIFSL